MEYLSISLTDHHNALISVFERLLEKEALVDCTLASEGKFLKAHKIVLSACSPYLEALLNQENDKHPILFLRDVKFEHLKSLAEFMYCGEIKILADHLGEFLKLAESLQVKGIGSATNKKCDEQKDTAVSKEQDNLSPVPKKRPRCHSKYSESSNENEVSSDLQHKKDNKHAKEKLIEDVSSITSSHETAATSKEFHEDIKVKEEVIDLVSAQNSPLFPEETITDPLRVDVSVELLEVKDEPITEEYSGVLHVGNGAVKTGIQSVNVGPNTSHQYSGFPSNPCRTSELETQVGNLQQQPSDGIPPNAFNNNRLEGQAPYEVGDTSNRHPLEGFSSKLFDTGKSVDQTQHVVDDEELSPAEGCSFTAEQQSSSEINANRPEGEWRENYENGSEDYFEDGNSSVFIGPQPNVGVYQCSLCPKSFKYACLLRSHSLTHTGERPFRCSYCSARFKEKGSLKRHLRIHTGERPYPCAFCSSSFMRLDALSDHTGRVHNGYGPYKCTYCKNIFSKKSKFLVHLNSHNVHSMRV